MSKLVTLSIRVTPQVDDWLAVLADGKGLSKSVIARTLLTQIVLQKMSHGEDYDHQQALQQILSSARDLRKFLEMALSEIFGKDFLLGVRIRESLE
ncbi:hypothetical protein [Kordiimonas marina]|uniref:hypothetical protein n=1 Tax=Kordiimonas marina TaxID=2872312 RepID=UPI001FF65CCA|nr:hypothetical protein [Kordiimonas marina]MCJ9428072.1 hypothetical protein [Kordiimonas marina]